MEEGLVHYSGEQQSTGGRKAMGLEIVADARYAIGVSVTETRLRFVAADLRLGEMAYRKVHHPSVAEMENFGDFLTGELERFIDDNALDRDRLLGVGIARRRWLRRMRAAGLLWRPRCTCGMWSCSG